MKGHMLTGTISLVTSTPTFNQRCDFTYTISGPIHKKGVLRIGVAAFQNGQIVYNTAQNADDAVANGFKLGEDGSIWFQNDGGPADCQAELFVTYPHDPTEHLAFVSFTAAG